MNTLPLGKVCWEINPSSMKQHDAGWKAIAGSLCTEGWQCLQLVVGEQTFVEEIDPFGSFWNLLVLPRDLQDCVIFFLS